MPHPSSEDLQKGIAADEYFQKPNHIRIISEAQFKQMVGDAGLAPSPPLAMGRVASAHDVAEEVYRAALKRKRLLVLSNVNWRARLLARYFPWLFERALLPRISGIKPDRGGR